MREILFRFMRELQPVLLFVFGFLVIIVLCILVLAVTAPQYIQLTLMFSGIILFGLLIAIILFTRSKVIMVEESTVAVVERLGRFFAIYDSGPHVLIPFMDKLREIKLHNPETGKFDMHRFVDMREHLLDPPPQIVTTKDNVTVTIDSVAYYRIIDPKKAIYNVGNLYLSIHELMITILRNTIGGLTLDETFGGREEINHSIKKELAEVAQQQWGVLITNVGLQQIKPPDDMLKEMERQAVAERKARALRTEAAAERDAAIEKATGEKRAVEMKAEAEKEAIMKIKQALSEAGINDDLIKLKYLEALQKISDGKATKVFLPFETSKFLGSVGSLKEMWEGQESKSSHHPHHDDED